MKLKVRVLGLTAALLLILGGVSRVQAAGIGMHVLHPEEFSSVASAFSAYRQDGEPLYITIPFTLDDVDHLPAWQSAFNVAKDKNIVPIVRLATHFDSQANAWTIPTQYDIVRLATALDSLNWPQEQRDVILFNEPNHAGEWGGTIDPHSFALKTNFALDWFGTEPGKYFVLPAALDLAASDTKDTKEAFAYWQEVLGSKPEILDKISAWNSHSYPNPAFSAAPSATGKNRLDGYKHELAFLRNYTKRTFDVYITETGWESSAKTQSHLTAYYLQAMRNVWSDPKIAAVTPFVFAGSPGPFAAFSFMDENGNPTPQWQAFSKALAVGVQPHLASAFPRNEVQ